MKVDPERRDRVAIDWDGPAQVLTAADLGQLMAQVAGMAPGTPWVAGAQATGTPGGIPLPTLPPQDPGATEEQLREQVRAMGATGRAIVDDVRVTGPRDDGRMGYQLSMWVQLDSGPAFRVENGPAGVDSAYTHRVVPGVTVPLRVAQVGPGVTMTVLEWDRL